MKSLETASVGHLITNPRHHLAIIFNGVTAFHPLQDMRFDPLCALARADTAST